MRITFSGISNRVNSKAGLENIQSGEILSVKITKNKQGSVKAILNGKNLSITGRILDLKNGDLVKVKTEWVGKKLYLHRLDSSNAIKNILSESGIKPEPNSILLFEAIKRAELPLKSDLVKELKRILRKSSKLSPEQARTAAEAIKKGLSPDEYIASFEHKEPQDRQNKEETLLFNSLSGDDYLWFIVPYNFSIAEQNGSVSGSLRIKKNIASKKIETVVIEASAGTASNKGRYFFLIDKYQSNEKVLRIFTEGNLSKSEMREIKKRLPEILGNLPVKIDDNINENCFDEKSAGFLFDGYSYDESVSSGFEEVV